VSVCVYVFVCLCVWVCSCMDVCVCGWVGEDGGMHVFRFGAQVFLSLPMLECKYGLGHRYGLVHMYVPARLGG